MKTSRPFAPRALAAITALALLPSCESATERVLHKEDHLAAAGFAARPADTQQLQAMLNRLPPHRFVRRVRNNSVFYVYADPTACDCLYIGDQAAYSQYQQYRQQKMLADEQEMTAGEYQDASWNWGAWGPMNGPGWGGWNPSWNQAWGNWDPGMGAYNSGW
ncbi:hypothetical protein [Acetobacter nitrogenifigens]|nr:hypothetical protein [Acetobacter nitrogenifigens]